MADRQLIRTLDVAALRQQYRAARPFPFVAIEYFLDPAFALAVAAEYPTFETAKQIGFAR